MGKSIKFHFTLFIAKAAAAMQKLLRMNATYFPGKLAIKLCPDFLGQIDKPKKIIGVTGTNGKTTVCNLIIDVLKENNVTVLDNHAGSNINAGLASALIKGSTISGKAKFDTAVFEIDERSSTKIFPYIKPDFLVCTNLFRDSIHRNAHAEYIFDIINDNLPDSTHMILNADDPISSRLKPENIRTYYSIDKLETDLDFPINIINDMQICPECRTKLNYNYSRYHHIGNVYCPNCGFKSPDADYSARVDFENMQGIIKHKGDEIDYKLISDSIFNTYNQLAAITLLKEYGLSYKQIQSGFEKIKIVESRYSEVKANNVEIVTHMAKGQNPIACSCVFSYVKSQPGKKEIILILDDIFDRKGSSENMTWIFDADFEFLNDESIKRIVIGGVRSEDYKLRLLIAGVDESKIFCERNEFETPKLLELKNTDKVYILHELYAADTALKIRDITKQEAEKRGENKNEN